MTDPELPDSIAANVAEIDVDRRIEGEPTPDGPHGPAPDPTDAPQDRSQVAEGAPLGDIGPQLAGRP